MKHILQITEMLAQQPKTIISIGTKIRHTLHSKFFEITVPCVLTTNASDLLERLST